MYKTAVEATAFVREFVPLVLPNRERTVALCPPFTALAAVVQACRETGILVGGQNMHWEAKGAYTGEVSPEMLRELGCRLVIIGHSERRQYFGETNESANKKLMAAFRCQLLPVLCVGETLSQREAGETATVCRCQTEEGLAGLQPEQVAAMVIAYEPVWAIGTGRTASAKDAQTVISFIRGTVANRFGQEAASQLRIQYGGSVKPDNIKELMAQPDIDGVLVGGASLEATSFAAIVNY